jgi:hypothetical protein
MKVSLKSLFAAWMRILLMSSYSSWVLAESFFVLLKTQDADFHIISCLKFWAAYSTCIYQPLLWADEVSVGVMSACHCYLTIVFLICYYVSKLGPWICSENTIVVLLRLWGLRGSSVCNVIAKLSSQKYMVHWIALIVCGVWAAVMKIHCNIVWIPTGNHDIQL